VVEGEFVHEVTIPNDNEEKGRLIIAPFYQYDFNTDSPELLTTMGRNCQVHSELLRTRPKPYDVPTFTRKQQRLFHDREKHAPLIDVALDREHDITLQAKVQCYQNYHIRMRGSASQLAALKARYDKEHVLADESLQWLKEADTYNHLRDQIHTEVRRNQTIPLAVR
jgi:hypothetical protein